MELGNNTNWKLYFLYINCNYQLTFAYQIYTLDDTKLLWCKKKTTTKKKQTPLDILFDYSTTRPSFKHLKLIFFYQVAVDGESVSTFKKRPLVAELKLKT